MAKVSNIIKNLTLGLCIVLFAVFGFVGCGSGFSTFKDNPSKNDVVTGNGTLAVTKGNYLYFANGFVGYESVTEGLNGNTEYASLYRVKLDENGRVVNNDVQYDEDGNEIFDETQGIKNVDILCKKIVGFENLGLFIFGDYIYFTTPNDQKSVVDGVLTLRTDLIDICRTKIDRSSGVEKIYTTENEASSCSYTMVEDDGEVSLIVYDGQKLVVKKIINEKIQGQTVVAENVTSCALPKYENSSVSLTNLDKDIYYTRNIDTNLDSEKGLTAGNVLMKFNIKTLKTSIVRADGKTSFVVKQTNGKYLFVEETYTENGYTCSSYIYAFENPETDSVRGTKITSKSYTSFIGVNPDLNLGVLASDGSNLYYIGVDKTMFTVYSGSVTLLKVVGSDVYFIADSNIYKISYKSAGQTETNYTANSSPYAENSKYVCINGDKIYYLKTYTNANSETSYYLHMIDVDYFDEDGIMYDNFVGVLMEKDYLTEETE